MVEIIVYKGYAGSVEYSKEGQIFYGRILGIGAVVSYEGTDRYSCITDFHETVDEYLESCCKEGMAAK